jgi:outer membrane protein OmpA-like peptidoglycan-associated protein
MGMADLEWRHRLLCEVVNGGYGPEVVTRVRRPKGPQQLDSWVDPRGAEGKAKDLVGQIFFKSDDRKLDKQDLEVIEAGLDYYTKYQASFYRSSTVLFKFVGNADKSGSASYNDKLALDRAKLVQIEFDRSFAFNGYKYYQSTAESLGESRAQNNNMAYSRRVDIFSNFVITKDTSVLFDQYVQEGRYWGTKSRKFKIRTLAGGSFGFKVIFGVNVLSIEILNPQTERTAMYTLASAGVGLSWGLNRPSDWTEVDAIDYLDVDDFGGPGRILINASAGLGGGQVLEFDGPMSRGLTTKPIMISLTGWDLQVGGGIDLAGYWFKRS